MQNLLCLCVAFEKDLFLGTYGNMLNANNNLKLLNAYIPKSIKYTEKILLLPRTAFRKIKVGRYFLKIIHPGGLCNVLYVY